MTHDPLDPIKKLQAHLDALRHIQGVPNFNISNPKIDASRLNIQFKTPGGPVMAPPAVPDPLVEWMLADLPPRTFHDLAAETVAQQKAKGYRAGHVPRVEGLKLLKKRYDKDMLFRARCAAAWLAGRKKEDDAFRLIKPADARANPWPAVERFGFPLAMWLFLQSTNGAYRPSATQVLKEVTAKQGHLEELLAASAAKTGEVSALWALPEISRDEEIARVQAEVEQILAERDRLTTEAAEERSRREKAEEELRKQREETQRLAQAKSAAEHARQALEARARELESHLEGLRGAESALKRLEKTVKELEHERHRLSSEKDAIAKTMEGLTADRDALRDRAAETETTLRHLNALLAQGSPRAAAAYQGQALLLIMPEVPASFFEAAKRLGLTLLVHDGRARDAHLDKSLERAWRVFVLGDPGLFHEGALRAARAADAKTVFLPALDAAAFEKLLAAAARL